MGKPKLSHLTILILASRAGVVQSQGFLTTNGLDRCLSNGLDWYTQTIGETPCRTYQRLRQLCNPVYKVEPFWSLTPGDSCNEQLSQCCCNSVSWALSMLCMNCQAGAGLPNLVNGIDAGKGAYQMYLGNCGQGLNRTLPASVQDGVCNQRIDIRPSLYNLFWGDGAWFYAFTSQAFTLDSNSNPRANFTNCPITSSSSSSIATTTSTQPAGDTATPAMESPASEPSSSNTGVIAGAVAGGLISLIAVAVLIWWLLRRRRRRGAVDLLSEAGAGRGAGPVSPFLVSVQPPNSNVDAGPSSVVSLGVRSKGGPSYPTIQQLGPSSSAPYSDSSGSQAGDTYADASTASGSENDGLMHPSPYVARPPQLEKSAATRSSRAPPMPIPLNRVSEDRTTVLPERHEDAGVSLGRSGSGRLPPAYPF